MAKQVGSRKITGTIDDITFYIREGVYLARGKSSLTRSRYLKDPAFEGSRRSNREMEIAAPLASKLYALMEPEKKGRPVFQKLVGRIKLMVKEGWSENAIEQWFRKEYLEEVFVSNVIRKKKILIKPIKSFANFYIRYYSKPIKERVDSGRTRNKEPGLCLI